jgi:hypothetical protein
MRRNNAWLGIDPGISGAIALLSETDDISVYDWPGDPAQASNFIIEWLKDYSVQLAVLERVSAMPKQGVRSVFHFGFNYGQWDGLLAALKIPFIKDPPRLWQKGLIRKTDGPDTKSRSLSVARRLFPNADLRLKKHHNRADAILLAYYARNKTIQGIK